MKASSRTSRSRSSAASGRRERAASAPRLPGAHGERGELLVADRAVAVGGERRDRRRGACRSTRHCQSCEREISAVAASSMRLLIAAAPLPRSHESRYWSATETFSRTPASVTAPPSTRRSSSAARVAGHLGAERRLVHAPRALVGRGAQHAHRRPRSRAGRDPGARPTSRRSRRATRAPCRRARGPSRPRSRPRPGGRG